MLYAEKLPAIEKKAHSSIQYLCSCIYNFMGCIVHMIQFISYPEYILNHCGEDWNSKFVMQINELFNSEHSRFIQISTPYVRALSIAISIYNICFLPAFLAIPLSIYHSLLLWQQVSNLKYSWYMRTTQWHFRYKSTPHL